MSLQPIQPLLGYIFKDVALAQQALTHRSYLNELREPGFEDYQRLEFLGDAILGLLLADFLYQQFTGLPEGDLSRMRASLVDQPRLAALAIEEGLSGRIFMGKGAEQEGGRNNPSILADVFEALIGAIYRDGGFAVIQQVVKRIYSPFLAELAGDQAAYTDAKSELQEWLATQKQPAPVYTVIHQQGPDHDRQFSVIVEVAGVKVGQGIGRSKKAAQQAAAEVALTHLRHQHC